MRTVRVLAVLLALGSFPVTTSAQGVQPGALVAEARGVHAEGEALARSINDATGRNVSPVLAMAALGGYRWYRTPAAQRGALPWHQQPWFWGACLVFLGCLALAQFVPGLRSPMEAINLQAKEVVGVLGLLAAAATFAAETGGAVEHALAAGGELLVPSALAATTTGSSHGIASALAVPAAFFLGLVIAAAVWFLFQAIGVLVFVLSPIGIAAGVLRVAKFGLLVTLVAATAISPTLGAVLAAVIVAVAFALAGWAFRMVVFGTILTWDILGFRREKPAANRPVPAFSTSLAGVPRRSWGTVVAAAGRVTFSWRPWLVLRARRVDVPGAAAVGNGLLSPVLLIGQDKLIEVARFPPRFRGAHVELAAALGDLAVVDMPLVKGIKMAIAWSRGAVEAVVSSAATRRRAGVRPAQPM